LFKQICKCTGITRTRGCLDGAVSETSSMKSQNFVVDAFGFVFLFIWIVSIVSMYQLKAYSYAFWFCNLAIAVLAIACFQKSYQAIYFILSIGIVLETPMILDWTYFLLTGNSILNLSSYFTDTPQRYAILSFIRHLLTVPISLGILTFFKPEKLKRSASFVWAAAVVIIMAVSYYFGSANNINCVHKFCFPIAGRVISGPFYPFVWTGVVITISLASTYFIVAPLHRWLYKITHKTDKTN
jgi:hypothetical protein